MLKKLSTLLLVLTVFAAVNFAQDTKSVQMSNVTVTGEEVGTVGSSVVLDVKRFNAVVAGDLNYNFVGTNVFTGYDLQSNGVPQQIWIDPSNTSNVHMVATNSAQTSTYSDRNAAYVFSDDMGSSWQSGGFVIPSPTTGGFAAIHGMNDGRPVVGLHSVLGGLPAARAQVFVRNSAGSGWENYAPVNATSGSPIWPRVLGVGNDKIIMSASINGAPDDDFFTTVLTIPAGTFTPWFQHMGDQAETHNVAKSTDEMTIGLAYVGNAANGGNAYYRESNDGGLSWGDPVLIYTFGDAGDSLGAMRGIDIIMLGDVPYVVFEVIKQDLGAGTYFSEWPNAVLLWSPDLNNGTAVVIADSNNIPVFEHEFAQLSNDVQGPMGRPSIGKSSDDQMLFITINAATADQLVVGTDANTYYAGYFMYSMDGGVTFSAPEKFTPETPLRDWRYISLAPINYISDGTVHVMMSAQADTIPGSTVNNTTTTYPKAVSAELVFISTDITTDVNDGTPVFSYALDQNYPNPFNPTTSIRFSLPERSNVSLKVYDVLGKEVATLLNETREAGSHNVTFNSSNLASGMYLYTLKAGSFTSTKKMILIK